MFIFVKEVRNSFDFFYKALKDVKILKIGILMKCCFFQQYETFNIFFLQEWQNTSRSGKLLTTSPVIYVKKQRIYYILKFFQHVRNTHFKGALLQKQIFSDFLNRQFLLGFSNLIEWHMSDPMFSPRVQVTFRRRRDNFNSARI